MVEPYYNLSYGRGFEGFLNYGNELVGGWLANVFLFLIFIVSVSALSKSEWKMSSVLSFSFFMCFIASIIMKLFMAGSDYVIILLAIGIAVCVVAGWLSQ
jgi:hypothetical protein